MSNSLAIAAVTATLQSLVTKGLNSFSGLSVTIAPLDKARPSGTTASQINIFLYQVARNAAWSNADMPRQNLPGELSIPPMPLNLYYLLTAYGNEDDASQPSGHELLGKAMSVLYDNPILSADEIKGATAALTLLSGNDLDGQFEHVRVTSHPITVDELSKLWTGFATQYRLSVAYEVGPVLIESTRAAAAPLPILTRGAGDSGVSSQTSLTPVVPTLESIAAPLSQPAALLGDTITLSGFHLDGTNVRVAFSHPLLAAPIERPALAGGTDKQITVKIPNQPTDWPPGFYGVTVILRSPGETFDRVTNQLMLPLSPAIKINPQTAGPGPVTVNITVTSTPDVWLGQRVTLLLGDQELPFPLTAAKTNSFAFPNVTLATGLYYVRLRVDGVDSLLVNRGVTPPIYDPSQRIVVT
jgi:Pvc16 N-terminal domain